MNAEEPDFKPGFLRGLHDAEGATPPPPAGGWQRLESELSGRRKRPVGWFWMAAALLAGLVGYWTLRPDALLTPANAPQGELAGAPRPEKVTAVDAASQPASAGEKATALSNASAAKVNAPDLQSPSTSREDRGTQPTIPTAASGSESVNHPTTTTTNSKPTIALAKRRPARQPQRPDEAKTSTQNSLDQTLLSEAAASTTGDPARAYSTNPTGETGARTARARRRGRAVAAAVPTPTLAQATQPVPTATEASPTVSADSKTGTTTTMPASIPPPTASPATADAPPVLAETAPSVAATEGSPAPAVAASDSAKAADPKPAVAEAEKAKKPEEPFQKAEPTRFSFEAGAHLLVRQRTAALSAREDRAKLSWTTPQPNILPGLELYGGLGYRLNRTFVAGGSVGLGLWQERLSVDMAAQDSMTHMSALGADVYQMNVGYQTPQTRLSQWLVAQTHTELWLRLAPVGAPIQVQVGPTLDALTSFARKGDAATGTLLMPGLAAAFRFTAGRMYYDLGIRKPFGKTINVPGYYTLQYQQLVTVGLGYTW